jgi:hypothetical protein
VSEYNDVCKNRFRINVKSFNVGAFDCASAMLKGLRTLKDGVEDELPKDPS